MTTALQYEALVRPHLPELRQYCGYLAGAFGEAEDLYQDTLMKSLAYYLRAGEMKEIRPFLFTVAKNGWIDSFRRRERRATGGLWLEPAFVDGCYFEIHGWVEWLAQQLPPSQLNVWLLIEYFGYSMKDIAARLGLTVPAVRSQLHRARQTLRSCMASGRILPPAAGKSRRARARPAELPIDQWVQGIVADNPEPLFRHGWLSRPREAGEL